MVTLPNLFTLFRGLLAFVFLLDDPLYRAVAVILAGLSDYFDGFLARKLNQESSLGRMMDPIMDKFFVFFVVTILLFEQQIGSYHLLLFLLRDCITFLFTIYLVFSGQWRHYKIKPFWLSKVITSAQFVILCLICILGPMPEFAFWPFWVLAALLAIEIILYHLPTTRKSIQKD